MLARIFTLPLHGELTPATANAAIQALHARTLYRPSALLVNINSRDGCHRQAVKLAAAIEAFSRKHKCLTIAFAEDYCLGPAVRILSSATRCYCVPTSMIGQLITPENTLDFSQNKLNVQYKLVGSGIDPMKTCGVEEYAEVVKGVEEETMGWLKNSRKRGQWDTLGTEIVIGQQAVDMKLVDGISGAV